jgi:hypothetical protein
MWGIPYVIVEAVAHHHHLERVACEKGDLLSSVYFANWLAHDHEAGQFGVVAIPNAPLNPEIVARLGVEDLLPDWRVEARNAAQEMVVPHG